MVFLHTDIHHDHHNVCYTDLSSPLIDALDGVLFHHVHADEVQSMDDDCNIFQDVIDDRIHDHRDDCGVRLEVEMMQVYLFSCRMYKSLQKHFLLRFHDVHRDGDHNDDHHHVHENDHHNDDHSDDGGHNHDNG